MKNYKKLILIIVSILLSVILGLDSRNETPEEFITTATPSTTSIQKESPTQGLTSEYQPKATIEPVIALDYILVEINELREKKGLEPLTEDVALTKGANARAMDLAKKLQWSHDGYVEALIEAGLRRRTSGENLARWIEDSDAPEAWRDSPDHAAIMFDPVYTRGGIGRYEGYIVLWVSN